MFPHWKLFSAVSCLSYAKFLILTRKMRTKMEFLQSAAVRLGCVKKPHLRIVTAGISFQQLYSEMKVAGHPEGEGNAVMSAFKIINTIPPVSDTNCSMNFSGQGNFGRGKLQLTHSLSPSETLLFRLHFGKNFGRKFPTDHKFLDALQLAESTSISSAILKYCNSCFFTSLQKNDGTLIDANQC